jgi:DNA-binding response OmpR family regulator
MKTERISVLLVAGRHRHRNEIERLLGHTQWDIHQADGITEARALLRREIVQVVLCQRDLWDGSWKDVLKILDECDSIASLVVLSDPDESTWGEVLNMGGYDLLPLPCSPRELYAIIPAAWRHCMQRIDGKFTALYEECCG